MTDTLETPPPPMPPSHDDGSRPRVLADRPGRVLVLLFGGLLTIALLAWGTFNIATLIARDRVTTAVSFPGPVRHLKVTVGSGDVTVVGRSTSDREGVTGTRTVTRGLTSPTITEQVEGDRLSIDSSCSGVWRWCSVSYSLSVPSDMSVEIVSGSGDVDVQGLVGATSITSGSGDLRADSVAGLSARTSSGDITVAGATGDVDLRTNSGDIDARDLSGATAVAHAGSGDIQFEFATAPTEVTAEASSGDVGIVVPADGTGYQVDARTSSGTEHVGVPRDAGGAHRLAVNTSSGDITVIQQPR